MKQIKHYYDFICHTWFVIQDFLSHIKYRLNKKKHKKILKPFSKMTFLAAMPLSLFHRFSEFFLLKIGDWLVIILFSFPARVAREVPHMRFV